MVAQPFEDYWDKEAVQRGLKSKDLIQVGPLCKSVAVASFPVVVVGLNE